MPANVNASTLAPFSTALSRGGVLVIVGMLGGVVLLSLLGRVCGRGKGIRGFRGDDVLAVMAFVSFSLFFYSRWLEGWDGGLMCVGVCCGDGCWAC